MRKYDEIWEKIRNGIKNWGSVWEDLPLSQGYLHFVYRCSKNYEGASFQDLYIQYYPDPNSLVYKKGWDKEGCKVAPIKDAVLDRLKVRIEKYLHKENLHFTE